MRPLKYESRFIKTALLNQVVHSGTQIRAELFIDPWHSFKSSQLPLRPQMWRVRVCVWEGGGVESLNGNRLGGIRDIRICISVRPRRKKAGAPPPVVPRPTGSNKAAAETARTHTEDPSYWERDAEGGERFAGQRGEVEPAGWCFGDGAV